MSEELTGQQPVGVGEGRATGAEGAVAAPGTTAEVAGQAIAGQEKPVVDLTEMEEFRRWQSARDKAETQLRQRAQAAEDRAVEMQRQLEELRLRDADPEEVAAYYQDQMKRVQVQQQEQAQAAGLRQDVESRAAGLLERYGLDVNTPGLDWSGGATWEGYAALAESVAKITTLQAQEATKQTGAVAAEAAEAARAEALAAAGVTRVSTATGAAPAGENPIANITDPDELLRMGISQGRRK